MATTTEEAKAKLSLDLSSLQGAKQSIAEFGDRTVENFKHMNRESRALHQGFHQLLETSPLLGNALKLAFSPLAGVIGLVTIGIIGIRQQMEAANKEVEKMVGYSGKPIGGLNPQEASRTAREAITAIRRQRDDLQKETQTDPALNKLEIEKEKIQENARIAKKLADDEHEATKRRIQDEATLRERLYSNFPLGLRHLLGRQLEDAKTISNRAADDAHVNAIRGIEDNSRFQQRMAVQAALKDLGTRREAAFYESNEAFYEAERLAGASGQRTITGKNIAGLEAERQKTEKELDEAKVELFKATHGGGFWSGLATQAGLMASNFFRSVTFQRPVTDPRMLGKVGATPEEAERKVSDLERKYRGLNDAIENGKDLLKQMSDAEKDSSRTMEQKAEVLNRLESEYAKLSQELQKLGGPISVAPIPILDPLTGGIRYKPLQSKGGVPYKPLPNSLDLSGYSPAAMAQSAQAGPAGPEPIMNVRIVDVKDT